MSNNKSSAPTPKARGDDVRRKFCLKLKEEFDKQNKAYSYRKVRLPECRSTPES